MNNEINPELAQLQETLYKSNNPTRRWLHTRRRDTIIELILKQSVDSSTSAVEVGPGSGVYLPTLCKQYDQVTALDIEITHLNAIKPLQNEFGNLTLMHRDIASNEAMPCYDMVLASEVLEHVPSPELFVKGIAKSIKPGGTLILSTPQPFSFMELVCKIGLSKPMISIVQKIYGEPVLPTGHISLTSKQSLKKMLLENNFEIVEESVQGLYIPFLAEFGGQRAVSISSWLEKKLISLGITWPIWTQIYIAKRKA
ncbi:class I SAM-dependent methyltransferase [Vibrio coralliilyticus]|uniref:class I SAM-dependent methyltransferase n=1 Tax=Vibrio coralliilyticus TaxID=190893 RepID=UPI000BAAC321|nr:class I SAM-dependent methyltransferase [Vibrio coralliilyticus]NOI60037.1 class I SAM-dependent methyltransferase [Vibrio coralliilyticus]PAT65645.1 hypothetical protein CKA27_23330 [Vibrio coralliilyticus]